MRNPLLAPELRELLAEGRQADLVQVIQDLHPNDAASILSALEHDEIVEVMSLLPIGLERDVFTYLEPEEQQKLVIGSGRGRVKELLSSMPSDDRAEFMENLEEEVRSTLYPLLSKAAREDLLRRARFEDDQVGSLLSTEYCVLDQNLTTVRAIQLLRQQAPNKETIYYSYVLDRAGRLKGFVSLRELICAPDDTTVGEIMRTEMVRVRADADQEEAATLIREYDLLALPVVDEHDQLVGIVTYDDAEDIIEEEVTEDVELMAGVTGDTDAEGYMDEGVISSIRRRAPVITFAALFFTATALVIGSKLEQLGEHATLLALLPMVMATGGSVGVQSSSLLIRALTIGNVEPAALAKVLWKEARISMALAALLSGIAFAEGLIVPSVLGTEQVMQVCYVLAAAMTLHVVISAVLGAVVPLVVHALRRDPATFSAPLVTAFADLSGATIAVLLAAAMLG